MAVWGPARGEERRKAPALAGERAVERRGCESAHALRGLAALQGRAWGQLLTQAQASQAPCAVENGTTESFSSGALAETAGGAWPFAFRVRVDSGPCRCHGRCPR